MNGKMPLSSRKWTFLEVTKSIHCHMLHKVAEPVSIVLQEGTVIAAHPDEARKLLCYYPFAFKVIRDGKP